MKWLLSPLYALRWSLLLASVAIGSLFATWHVLAAVDFGYSTWYDVLSIDQTIDTYGPANPIRPDFHLTDRAEHERLFGAIVDAVHADGRGLEDLVYRTPDGEILGTLLTEPEVVHLQDVARLINVSTAVSWVAIAGGLILLAGAALRGETPPSGRRIGIATAAVVGGGTVMVLLIGPERVFNWLHEMVFPAEHEWFFYYEESLMTMLMQAPNLFAPIAISWLLLTVLLGGHLVRPDTRASAHGPLAPRRASDRTVAGDSVRRNLAVAGRALRCTPRLNSRRRQWGLCWKVTGSQIIRA